MTGLLITSIANGGVDVVPIDYLELFLDPIRVSKNYKPKFGQSQNSSGFSLAEFRQHYGADPFYSWIGIDDQLMYAAHKAAGGMTSIYRQIGVGCENLFRQIIVDTCQYLDPALAKWSYEAKTSGGKNKTLALDGRLELSAIQNVSVAKNLDRWIRQYLSLFQGAQFPSNGVVFEVRQGYKSKDSKRQNADIDNATVAWASGYLPVFAIFSSQIDTDLMLRYRNNRCGILVGQLEAPATISLYSFTREILGFDLAGFFGTHSKVIRDEVRSVLSTLLSPEEE